MCDTCGRITSSGMSDWLDWLIAYRVRDRRGANMTNHTALPLVQRCPQHVTRWSMCRAGVSETKANFERVRLAKERDNERLANNPLYGRGYIYAMPDRTT